MIVKIKDRKILNPAEVRAFFEALKDGEHRIEAKDGSLRSINQNAYYWLMCELLVSPLRDLGWDLDNEGVHEFLKNRFLRKLVLNEKTNQFFYQSKSTTRLSKSEINEYFRQIHQFAAEELGVVLPDPE